MKNFLILLILIIGINAKCQTSGTLTVTFTENVKTGCYSGNDHVLAAWITNNVDVFKKTKLKYCCTGATNTYLNSWGAVAGATLISPGVYDASTGNVVDATTGATLTSFATRTFTWDGKDSNGTLLPDAPYRLYIQSTWNTGFSASFTTIIQLFKQATVWSNTPSNVNFSNIVITWTPDAMATAQFVEAPAVNIYPNPSNNGIFTLDFSNDANSIKVCDVLGKIVFQEKNINQLEGSTKTIDLSSFANGMYFINLTNDKGSSNYKVLINR